MNVNTRKSLVQSRKKKLSLKVCDNESNIAKPATKRVASKKCVFNDNFFFILYQFMLFKNFLNCTLNTLLISNFTIQPNLFTSEIVNSLIMNSEM